MTERGVSVNEILRMAGAPFAPRPKERVVRPAAEARAEAVVELEAEVPVVDDVVERWRRRRAAEGRE